MNIGTMMARIGVDTAPLTKAGARMKAFTSRTVAGFARVKKSVFSLQGALVGFVGMAGMALIAKSSVKTAMAFEQSMLTVKGVTRATAEEFENMTNMAKKMGETTEWTASQSANALQFLGMAGFKAMEATQALPGVLDLATAGNIELARAADIASNALTAMQLPVSQLGKVNDVFVATITRTNTNMEMMAESFKYAAPVGKAFGYEIEELSAMIGQLGNAGIQGSMAGTQLAFAMQKATKVARELGIDSSNLTDVLQAMKDQGWSNERMLKAFGMRGGRAVLILKDMIPQIKALTVELENSEGEAKKLADIMRTSLRVAFITLGSAIESISIEAFKTYEQELRQLVKNMTMWVREHKDEIIRSLGVTKDFIGGLAKYFVLLGAGIGVTMAKMSTGTTDAATGTELLHLMMKKVKEEMDLVREIMEDPTYARFVGTSKYATKSTEELEVILGKLGAKLIFFKNQIDLANKAQQELAISTAVLAKEEKMYWSHPEWAYEPPPIWKSIPDMPEIPKEIMEQRLAALRTMAEQEANLIYQPEPYLLALEAEANFAKKKEEIIQFRLAAFKSMAEQEAALIYQPEPYLMALEAEANLAEKKKTLRESLKTNIINFLMTEEESIRASYANRIEMVKKALELQVIEEERAAQLIAKLQNKMNEEIKDKKKTFGEEIKTAITGWASTWSQTLTDMVWGAELTFGKILESFGKMLTQMAIQQMIIKPMLAGPEEGWMKWLFGAKGFAIENGVQKFAKGTIVNKPTIFPMQQGMGLIGEAGPEGVLPLTRTKGGDLGVKAEGTGANVTVNVINQTSQEVEAEQRGQPRFDGNQLVVDVILTDLNRRGPIFQGMMGARA